MLFRSFGFNTANMSPGTPIFSDEANEKGPVLVGIVQSVLERSGILLDQSRSTRHESSSEEPRGPTILEVQDWLEQDVLRIGDRYDLEFEELAHSAAVAGAWIIRDCVPRISPQDGVSPGGV